MALCEPLVVIPLVVTVVRIWILRCVAGVCSAIEGCHDGILKSLEGAPWEDLGEEVGHVVFGIDVHWLEDLLVPENLHPFLAAVDVLHLGLVVPIGDEGLSSVVVHFQMNWAWKRNVMLVSNVGKCEALICRKFAAPYVSAAPEDMSAWASPIFGCAKAIEETLDPYMMGAPLQVATYPF